jgi:hypothetical protein
MNMDESAMCAYFERVARAELPPSTVDVARARRAGRRRLTIRRAGVPVMLLGVVTAAAVLFGSGVLPARATHHRAAATGSHHHAIGPAAPASFDPLAISVTFGWLPPGFSAVAPPDPETTSQSLMDAADSHGQTISLTVFAARQCELTGPFWWPPKSGSQGASPGSASQSQQTSPSAKLYPAGLRCKSGATPWLPNPVVRAGHLAGGDPAYWMVGIDGQRVGLAWRYARGGWATAIWPGPAAKGSWAAGRWPSARPAELIRVAAHVRYRSHLRLPFPFQLAGMPASWKLSGAGYQVFHGKLAGYALYMGPSQDPAGMRLVVQPAFQPACQFSAGRQRNVSFDGAGGVLVSTPSEKQQDVCFPSLHGMFVWGGLDDRLGGAMGLLHHVRVLGPDPANWTTHPLG